MKKINLYITIFLCCFNLLSAGFGEIPKENMEYIQKEAASGNLLAQTCLGIAYCTGDGGLPIDKEKALYWLKKAANQKYLAAQEALVSYYFNEQQDLVQCLYWAKEAAQHGSIDSIRILGYCYFQKGDSRITPDLTESFKWFILAASAGDKLAREMLVNMNRETNLLKGAEFSNGLKRAATWLNLNEKVNIKISPEYLNINSKRAPN